VERGHEVGERAGHLELDLEALAGENERVLMVGLAIKNPPKQTHPKNPKNHLKKPTKNVFLVGFFWVFKFVLNFYENNTNFSL
jgi:hypothetical protein